MLKNISPSKYGRLQKMFEMAMHKRSRINHSSILYLWKIIINFHENRPYHNLDRYNQSLDLLGNSNVLISEEVVLAMLMQNYGFLPYNNKSKLGAGEWAYITLTNNYGWSDKYATEVCNLILSSATLRTPTLENANFETRFLYDIRQLRLALPWLDFKNNMKLLREEYKELTEKDFLTLHQKLFKWLNWQQNNFALALTTQSYNEITRLNIRKYLASISIRLEAIENEVKIRKGFTIAKV